MKRKRSLYFSKKWLGKKIVAIQKDGTVIKGKVVKVSRYKLWVKKGHSKKAHLSAIIPLVLYDLLAIGAGPQGYGPGYGPGYGGYPYAPYGVGHPGRPVNYGYGTPGWFY